MSENLFFNFNSGMFLEFFESKNAEGLRNILKEIRQPFILKSVYFDGKKHIAWIITNRPIKKVKTNGTTR